ncbi:MAG: hypothetical protein WDM78_21875 [Puia sp.]
MKKFAAIRSRKILIHGGGKLPHGWQRKWVSHSRWSTGGVLTDAETLKIVTMVYAGYINKNIVALLQSLQCNATGNYRRRWKLHHFTQKSKSRN